MTKKLILAILFCSYMYSEEYKRADSTFGIYQMNPVMPYYVWKESEVSEPSDFDGQAIYKKKNMFQRIKKGMFHMMRRRRSCGSRLQSDLHVSLPQE